MQEAQPSIQQSCIQKLIFLLSSAFFLLPCVIQGAMPKYLAVGSRSLGDWGGGARSPHVRWHGWRLPAVPGVQVLQGVGPGAVQAAQVDPPVTATLQRHQRQVEDQSTATGVRHKGRGVRHPSPLPRTPSLYRTGTCEKKVHNGCSLNRWFSLDQGVPGHGGGHLRANEPNRNRTRKIKLFWLRQTILGVLCIQITPSVEKDQQGGLSGTGKGKGKESKFMKVEPKGWHWE